MSVGTAWSVENPASSMLWELIPFKHLSMRDDVFTVDFPMCAYGTPYKKNTRILTNLPSLLSLHSTCGHAKHAQSLCGKVRVQQDDGSWVFKNRTELAGAYPQLLAETWASLVVHSPDLMHVETQFDSVAAELETRLQKAAQKSGCSEISWFEQLRQVNQFFPKLSQHILFGQDSAAVKEAKRARNRKQQETWKKVCAALGRKTQRP